MSEISKLDQNIIIKKIDKQTTNIQINNNEMLMSIVGQFDQNLKELSKLTRTNIFFRGNSLTIKGDSEVVIKTANAIKFLGNKYILTNLIDSNDIIHIQNGKRTEYKVHGYLHRIQKDLRT